MFKLHDLVAIGKAEGKNVDEMLEFIVSHLDKGEDSFEIYTELYKKIYKHHLCNTFCLRFVDEMYNSKEKGKKWTLDQTNDIARKIGISFSNNDDDYTQYEFYAVIHMMYYDYSEVFDEHGISNDVILYGKLADAYLDDIDSYKGKLVDYYFFVEKNKKNL